MVTLLVQRHQREAAQRKERLLAARRAAAQLSVQQARSYKEQKRKQYEDIREDVRKMWLQTQLRDVQTIDALLLRGAAHQNDGHEAAVQFQADMQREACVEDTAWQAEHELETARHRLAVAYARAEAIERQVPKLAAQRRREAVRSVERRRAARVAAAPPSALPLTEVMRSLRAAPIETEDRAARIPVVYPSNVAESTDVISSIPSDSTVRRRWRMSGVAPHSKVTLHVTDQQSSCEHVESADGEVKNLAVGNEDASGKANADPVQHATYTYALECASAFEQREKMLADGQQKAAQRAASALRRQHEERTQAEAERQMQRERIATVKEVYRYPRRDADEEAQKQQHRDAAAGQSTMETGAVDASDDIANFVPAPQPSPHQRTLPHVLTRQQQALTAYRKIEDDFRAIFIEGPPVAVHTGSNAPRTAPLEALLRPAQVADLLYSLAHDDSLSAAPTHTPPSPLPLSHVGRDAITTTSTAVRARDGVPLTRVLPSAPLRMQPLHPYAENSTSNAHDHHNSGRSKSPLRPAVRPESGAPQGLQATLQQKPCASAESERCADAGNVDYDIKGEHALSFPPQMYVNSISSAIKQQATLSSSPVREAATQQIEEVQQEIAISPMIPAAAAAVRDRQQNSSKQVLVSPSPTQQPINEDPMDAAELNVRMTIAPSQNKEKEEVADVSNQSSRVVSAATTPLSTPSRHTPHHAEKSLSSSSLATSTPLSGGSTDDSCLSGLTGENNGSSLMDSSGFSASTCTSSSRHPLPTMTAEQLKLALMRLRSRIKTAQM